MTEKEILDRINKYFAERPAISISTFEREAGIPAKSLDHFLKGRRNTLSIDVVVKVTKLIKKYSPEYNL